jgi:hypothetical protein
MKCHFLLFSVFSTILVSTHSFDGALDKTRDGSASSTLSDADTVKISETLMVDSVPVLSQPEVMISTVPMRTETVIPSQMIGTDPLMTDAAPNQMMTESTGKNTAEQTIPKPAMTDEETSSRGWYQATASDVLKKIFDECVQHGSFACVKPKVLSFLSAAVKKDKILLTDDLVIEKTGRMTETHEFEEPQQVGFASSHYVYIYTAWHRVT